MKNFLRWGYLEVIYSTLLSNRLIDFERQRERELFHNRLKPGVGNIIQVLYAHAVDTKAE